LVDQNTLKIPAGTPPAVPKMAMGDEVVVKVGGAGVVDADLRRCAAREELIVEDTAAEGGGVEGAFALRIETQASHVE
jgi:hypothetical protein